MSFLLMFKEGLDDLFQYVYSLFRDLKSAKSRCGLNKFVFSAANVLNYKPQINPKVRVWLILG